MLSKLFKYYYIRCQYCSLALLGETFSSSSVGKLSMIAWSRACCTVSGLRVKVTGLAKIKSEFLKIVTRILALGDSASQDEFSESSNKITATK